MSKNQINISTIILHYLTKYIHDYPVVIEISTYIKSFCPILPSLYAFPWLSLVGTSTRFQLA